MHPLEEIRHTASRLATECRRIVQSTNIYTESYRALAAQTEIALEIAVEATRPAPSANECTCTTPAGSQHSAECPANGVADVAKDIVIRSADGLRKALLTSQPPFGHHL